MPPVSQTADDVIHAERALTEIRARQADDQLHAEQERIAELARWHHEDQTERDAADEDGLDADVAPAGELVDPVLDR